MKRADPRKQRVAAETRNGTEQAHHCSEAVFLATAVGLVFSTLLGILYEVQIQPKPSDSLGPAVTRHSNSDGAYRHGGLARALDRPCECCTSFSIYRCFVPDNRKKSVVAVGSERKSIREED